MTRVTRLPKLPPRSNDGHKGTFGRVLVVGGSVGMVGAPAFAGLSALRLGSGLVQIATVAQNLNACLSIAPESIGVVLSARSLTAASLADAVVLGPGLGRSGVARSAVKRLIALRDKPMVVDADALNILAEGSTWPTAFVARAVLTPHPGEMKRLLTLLDGGDVPTDDAGRLDVASRAAQAFGQVVLLKGRRTVITDGRRAFINTTGDSSLSKAGTGDVLSGMIGSLLGQGMSPFDAACLGAHLHGRAGELAGKKLGKHCVLARDVIDAIPDAVRELEGSVA